MYRTGDPRFRRRLNEIGHTLENANQSAQSNLYIFGQTYVKPCFESITECFTTCVDASCPTLNLNANQRDRLRRQRGRNRGRAELSFDFYDDWDEDENDALMGWSNDEFDRLLAGSGGYGTVSSATQQPARQRGMSYPKGRRKSAVLPHDGGPDPTVIPGSSGIFSKLFGGKTLRYKPSAADLQEHPGARRIGADLTEGEALLREGDDGGSKQHRRVRSNTATSDHTMSSLSSRGDIFPSDEELDDAVPLDDEFAMVLERRTTQSGGLSGLETESSSGKTGRGKRPSTGSRRSTQSSRSRGGRKSRSRTDSSAAQTPIDEVAQTLETETPTITELKQEERQLEQEEEATVERKRREAQRLAAEQGLTEVPASAEDLSSKEATPQALSPVLKPVPESNERSQTIIPSTHNPDEEHALAYPQPGKDSGDKR